MHSFTGRYCSFSILLSILCILSHHHQLDCELEDAGNYTDLCMTRGGEAQQECTARGGTTALLQLRSRICQDLSSHSAVHSLLLAQEFHKDLRRTWMSLGLCSLSLWFSVHTPLFLLVLKYSAFILNVASNTTCSVMKICSFNWLPPC